MNKAIPLISCIIPTKNRPSLVIRAIQSVLGQSYHNIEVLVIDDSTNNDTFELLSKSDLSIRYFRNAVSRGAPFSRNTGIVEAKGDFIAFLDDDDYWYPRKIETQLQYIGHAPIVSCNSISILPNGKTLHTIRPQHISYQDLLYTNMIGSSSFPLIDAQLSKDVYFDEKLERCQDWDYWISLMKTNGVQEAVTADGYLAYYNVDPHPRITTTVESTFGNVKIYEKYIKEYNDKEKLSRYLLSELFMSNESRMIQIIGLLLKSKLSGRGVRIFLTLMMNHIRKKNYYYV